MIRQKVRSLPKLCGVYLMLDRTQKVIYIGKAKNLHTRVGSYFKNIESHHIKTRALLTQVHDLSYITVPSEVEALLLERNLIHYHQPKYNILLRDDKQFPMVRIDWNAPWPRIETVRKKDDIKGVEYIGPFAQVAPLNLILQTIYEVFPLIRCGEHEFNTTKRPCLYFHMHKCLGQCTQKSNRDEYISLLREATEWLKGHKKELLQKLEQKMWRASQAEDFERAGKIRDQIKSLSHFQSSQNVQYKTLFNVDVIDWVEPSPGIVSISICMVRDEKLLGHYNQSFELTLQSLEESLLSFLTNFYFQNSIPSEMYVRLSSPLIATLDAALVELKQSYQIFPLKKGEVTTLSQMARKNALSHAEHQKIFSAPHQQALSELQEICEMTIFPERIECIDISHFAGTATVAAIVCFLGGKPNKSEYRLYNIADEAEKPDDFESIETVLNRRFRKGSNRPDPDLLVIDGGKGQLSSAWKALKNCHKDHITVIGLAKARTKSLKGSVGPYHTNERIVKHHPSQTIELDPTSPVCGLLTRLRDETHRFAISHHRKRRSKIRSAPSLLRIPGIGPVLRKRILEAFPELDKIAQLSAEQVVEQIRGMPKETAQRLIESMQRHFVEQHKTFKQEKP